MRGYTSDDKSKSTKTVPIKCIIMMEFNNNSERSNKLGVLYIGIGEYNFNGTPFNRVKQIQSDINNIRNTINPIHSIELIQTKHNIAKYKWTAKEIIDQLQEFRNIIKRNNKYCGYILFVVSHGDNRGNGPYILTSLKNQNISYSTIRNCMRNAKDIPPQMQHKPRMSIIYTCKGAFKININNNSNNRLYYNTVGNTQQRLITAEYDQYFPKGVPAEIDEYNLLPDTNIFQIEASTTSSSLTVTSWTVEGTPPVLSFCQHINNNINKDVDFFGSFPQQLVNDIRDMHRYYKAKPSAIDPFGITPAISQSPLPKCCFYLNNDLQSGYVKSKKDIGIIFQEIETKKREVTRKQQALQSFLENKLHIFITDYSIRQ
eukprot:385602_1